MAVLVRGRRYFVRGCHLVLPTAPLPQLCPRWVLSIFLPLPVGSRNCSACIFWRGHAALSCMPHARQLHQGVTAAPSILSQVPRTRASPTGMRWAETSCPTRCPAPTGTRSTSLWRASPSLTLASRGSSPSTSPCWTTPMR